MNLSGTIVQEDEDQKLCTWYFIFIILVLPQRIMGYIFITQVWHLVNQLIE